MNEIAPAPRHFEKWRLYVVYTIILLVLVFYVIRLVNIQLIHSPEYLVQADENRTTEVNVQTQRGIILDRNGYVLARNIPSYNVAITPAYLPGDEGEIQEIYRQLSTLIDIPVTRGELTEETVRLFKPCETDFGITEIVYIGDTNAPYDPVRIKCDIDARTAMIIREKATDWPGVEIEATSVRDYPTGLLTSEVVGFLGPIPASLETEYSEMGFVADRDKVGYAGVEYSLQDILGGKNGTRLIEVDVAGQEMRDLAEPVDPQPGQNLRLTIDTRLQSAAKTALVNEINYWNTYLNEVRSSSGVVIAMNPKTGEIMAMVSYPTYENNRMARFIPADYYQQISQDPNKPLINHAISSEVPPGSVYKMAAAIGFMNEGVVAPEQKIECPDAGKIQVLQKYTPNDPGTLRDYVCWQKTGHGMMDFIHAVANSCDVYFYKVSGGFGSEVPEGLGVYRMAEYSRALGYGRVTGIELPGEMEGLVPDPTWKRINVGENWATGDTYIASMGQGYVLSTPLQVLVSVAILANDGVYMQPTVVREVIDENGDVVRPFEPQQVWDITRDPVITVFDEDNYATEEKKIVQPWVVELAKEGMRLAVTDGTAQRPFAGSTVESAGKTGTAEYCDNVAQSKNLCTPGNWPTHSWYVGYAPYDDPEIAVIAFVYNGGEGASVSAPIVRQVMEAYFELKAIDEAKGSLE